MDLTKIKFTEIPDAFGGNPIMVAELEVRQAIQFDKKQSRDVVQNTLKIQMAQECMFERTNILRLAHHVLAHWNDAPSSIRQLAFDIDRKFQSSVLTNHEA